MPNMADTIKATINMLTYSRQKCIKGAQWKTNRILITLKVEKEHHFGCYQSNVTLKQTNIRKL